MEERDGSIARDIIVCRTMKVENWGIDTLRSNDFVFLVFSLCACASECLCLSGEFTFDILTTLNEMVWGGGRRRYLSLIHEDGNQLGARPSD